MITKKDLKLFGIILIINFLTLFIEVLCFGVKLSRWSFMLLILFALIETFLLDKIVVKGGIF